MTATLFTPKRSTIRPFLTAEWRYLAMLNFRIDPECLQPFVPSGTRLDTFHGETYVSLVAFLFRNTRVLGMTFPHHRHFEELNLRFYVVREVAGELRRGVVFIKELAPRWAVCAIARALYNEKYCCVPMRHELVGLGTERSSQIPPEANYVKYQWKVAGRWHSLHMNAGGSAEPLPPGSHEEFIAEHYWGYSRQRDGRTLEYRVEHPPWSIWPAAEVNLDCDVRSLYGEVFAEALIQPPVSAFIANGSPITVSPPKRLTA